LTPFVQAGVSIGYAYQSSHFSGNPVNQTFTPGRSDKGIHFGAGLKYGRFGLQARYERSPGFSETRDFVSKVTNIFMLATIDLSKPKE
jgi:predicted porin